MDKIEIRDAIKHKCPRCGSVYKRTSDENKEILYRNITLVHIDDNGNFSVKCKMCKEMIEE